MPKVAIDTLANLENQSSAIETINSNFEAIQDAIDNTLSRDGTAPNDMDADLDMNSHKITNLPAPTTSTEPARHGDIQTYVDDAEGFAEDAETSATEAAASAVTAAAQAVLAAAARTAAETAETNAETAEANAETAETNAETAATLASRWATEAEDVVVSGGQYSAYHWAQKAQDIVLGDIPASSVEFAPSGNIAATDVQAAIEELDNEKQAASANLAEWSGINPSSNGGSLVSAADYAAMRALLDLEVGTDIQAYDAELAAIAGLTSAADRVPYFTGSGAAALATFTSAARNLLDDADVATMLVTLTARGQGLETIFIPAAAMVSRTTNGAASGTAEMSTNKNMFKTLDFDASTQEFAQFEVWFPKSWNLGTVTFQPIWSHASTTTNFGVVWALQGVARSDDDAGDVAFGTEQTSTDTGGTTNDIYLGPTSSAITIADTPAAGDSVQFQIKRNVSDGSDTMAIDARLHGVRLFFTTNAATDA